MFHLFWQPVVQPLLEAAEPRVVVEIGAHVGQTTRPLLELGAERDFVVHSIDPAPGPNFTPDDLEARYGDRFQFHKATSLDQLPLIEKIDVVMVDGDHNWYTVHNELKILARQVERGRPFPLTFVHDIGWPYGRRDLYYDPETIPSDQRQPHAKQGLTPGNGGLSGSEGLNPRLHNAETEGAPRSGVRTAVEDFLSEADLPIRFTVVEGFHGLGILAWEPAIAASPRLRAALERLDSPEWLREHCQRLEDARVRLLARLGTTTRQLRALSPD
jgi:Methyltransferase domain